ncbi:MAG: GNAT family N-acetyltransferase [Thermoguttaceae bacterium]
MLTYRTFRNTDPPVITAIWRSRIGQPGLAHLVSPELFEQLVFAKLYFDYEGLILAYDDDRPVGFAHAGFGPKEARNESPGEISPELGVVCLVMVRPDCAETEVAAGLLGQCEQYLHRRGAKVIYGGGIYPLNPFYLGLYGGSELPGVLLSDIVMRQVYASSGYREIDQTLLMRQNLGGFQAVIDRQQMQIRRRMIVEVVADAPARFWWEACTMGEFELTRYKLVPRSGGPPLATATLRSMEPSGTIGAGRAIGLIELEVEPSAHRRGLASFLLSEACRQFVRQGIMVVEAQVMRYNEAAIGLYHKLGFEQVDQGSVYRKDADA